MRFKKFFWAILGSLTLALGALGSILPILPTVPFLLLSGYSFARSSAGLNRWFQNTRLYKTHLADYAAGRGMTWNTKIRIMAGATVLMAVGFFIMGAKGIVTGCIILGCVWLLHILYFLFGVKTISIHKETATS